MELHYDTIYRECVEVPLSVSDYTDGTHQHLPSNGPARYVLDQAFEALDIGEIDFKGTVEYESAGVQSK